MDSLSTTESGNNANEESPEYRAARSELERLKADAGARVGVGRIIANGWEQGSVLTHNVLRALADAGLLTRVPASERTVGIVLSQSCDIVNHSYELEPEIEVWLVTQVTAPDAQYFSLKNPRRLHLEAEGDAGPCWFDVEGHARASAPRWALEVVQPATAVRLPTAKVRLLIDFLINRFQRPAFPDEFNRRRRKADRKIEQVLKKYAPQIYRLYARLNTFDELTDGTAYEVKLYLLVSQVDYADDETRRVLDQAAARISAALESCDDIDVVDFLVIPDISVRLSDLRRWTPWDIAEFSAGEDPTPRP